MNLTKYDNRIFVGLGSEIDGIRFQQISSSVRYEELHKPNGLVYYEVKNLNEASLICQKFISTFGLSSGNWTGGRVVNENGNFLARISYNGRIWDKEDGEKANEIV